MAWKIDDTKSSGVISNVHPNSGIITYKKYGFKTEASCCNPDTSGHTVVSLEHGEGFDDFTKVRETITYSYDIGPCNKDGFVTWFNNSGNTFEVLNNNNGFDEKDVDEGKLVIKGAPIMAGSGQNQYFDDERYEDSGFPNIIEYPYALSATSATCNPTNSGCSKYYSTRKWRNVSSDAFHKIKYHTSEATSGTIRTNTITNNQDLLELYFPHLYDNKISAITNGNIEYSEFEGSNIHVIEDAAFENNTNLTAITFSAVREIGNSAFTNCRSLVDIDWGHCACNNEFENPLNCSDDHNYDNNGEAVDIISKRTWRERKIGDYAFYNCYSLPELHLDRLRCLTELGAYSFYDCHSLKVLTFPTNSGFNTINPYTFWNCYSLSGAVSFPENIEKIDSYAFENGYSLSGINVEHISRFGEGAFKNCSGASWVKLSNSWSAISESCFENCTSLSGVTLSGFFTASTSYSGNTVGRRAFANCTNLGIVKLGECTKNIEEEAFINCTNLKTFAVSGSSTVIGESAFENCTSLSSVTNAGYIKIVSGKSFYNTDIHTLSMSDVEDIGNEAFEKSSSLSSVTIGNKIKTIGDEAFKDSRNLKTVKIGTGITSIGTEAFMDCPVLSSVTISRNISTTTPVPSLGADAFKNSTNNLTIWVPRTYVNNYKSSWPEYENNISGTTT